MTEEAERLKSDLKHTISARARAEGREDEVRSNLSGVEGELREARNVLRVAQNNLAEARDELQTVRDELVTSRSELRESKEELRAANDELRVKVGLLDGVRREASEATNSAKRLDEECGGLQGDLHQQITLVAQWDEVIGRLRDQASAQWASGWLAFQRRAADVYSNLDSTSTSLVTRRRRSLFLRTILKNRVLLLKLIPPLHHMFLLLTHKFLCSSPPA